MKNNNGLLSVLESNINKNIINLDDLATLENLKSEITTKIKVLKYNINTELIKREYDKLFENDYTKDAMIEFLPLRFLNIDKAELYFAAKYGVVTAGSLIYERKPVVIRKTQDIQTQLRMLDLTDDNGHLSIIDDIVLPEECPRLYRFIRFKTSKNLIPKNIIPFFGVDEKSLTKIRSFGDVTAKKLFNAFDKAGFVKNNRTHFPVFRKGLYNKIYIDTEKIEKMLESVNLPSEMEFEKTSFESLHKKYKD